MAIRAEIPLRNAARSVEGRKRVDKIAIFRKKVVIFQKKVVLVRKKWSWLKISGHFLEKYGLDVLPSLCSKG